MAHEETHNLLMQVLTQHYQHQPDILESANQLIQQYRDTKEPSYEKTLGRVYQMLRDLPSEILLYFLTTVPFPEKPDENVTVLQGLMKQMLCASYHNSMRTVLLQHLNKEMSQPAAIPETTNKTSSNDINSSTAQNTQKPDLNIRSVIDDNIRNTKGKKGIKSKSKRNYDPIKYTMFDVKPLAMLCALDFTKNQHQYFKTYIKQREDAWKLVNTNKLQGKDLIRCYDVIKDANKKIQWLLAFQSGRVPLDIIKNEYGNSDIFYLEKNLQCSVPKAPTSLTSEVQKSIDVFFKKC